MFRILKPPSCASSGCPLSSVRSGFVEPEGSGAVRVLMIGDTTHDLQMALNAGCASVGVSYGAHESDGFAALGSLHVAHSVADLAAWLSANG